MTSTIFGRPVVHVSHQKFKELYSKEELGVWVDYSGATKIAQWECKNICVWGLSLSNRYGMEIA